MNISNDDIIETANKITSKKTIGWDRVPGSIVKLTTQKRTNEVCRMFNDITEDGRIPRIWKTATVILLPKPGKDPLHPSAYRPISILPVLSKMCENILKKLIERCIGVDLFDNNHQQ